MDNVTARLNVEIHGTLQKLKSLLCQKPCNFTSCYVMMKEIVSLIPDSGWSPETLSFADNLTTARNIFITKYYTSFAECLLEHLDAEWLQPNEKGQRLIPLFDCCFLHGPPEEALIVLSHASIVLRPGICLFHCIKLTETLLKNGCLKSTLLKYCCDKPVTQVLNNDKNSQLSKGDHLQLQHWQLFVNTLSSLPDVILARASVSEDANFFHLLNYAHYISADIMTTLNAVHRLLHDGCTTSVLLIAALVGKLSMTGYAEPLWKYLVAELEPLCKNDFIWQRIIQQIIADIPERSIETVTIHMIMLSSSYSMLSKFLGTLPVRNSKMSYVLTYKLLLVRYFEGQNVAHILRNVIGYLAATSTQLTPLFLSAFRNVLTAWSDSSSLRHRSVQQSLYVCKALITCISFATPADVDMLHSDIVQNLLDGLQGYLGSSVADVRQMGCFVAEKLSSVVHQEIKEKALKFELVENDLIKSLEELTVRTPGEFDDGIENTKAEKANVSQQKHVNANADRGDLSELSKISDTGKSVKELDSDDSESDEELKPYPSFSKRPARSAKKPTYLAQCIDGLIQTDDPDRTEQCLLSAESLIRTCGSVTACELGVELSRVLLHLDDRYALPDFVILRHRALISVTVVCPLMVAEYLAGQFYARNYSIRQRMDILDVLAAAANELSQPDPKPNHQSSNIMSSQQCNPTEDPSSTHWSVIIQQRLESKTRRFGHSGSFQVTGSANKLTATAGSFFYPLMRFFDRQTDACIDLLGTDHLLFERLVYTLGSVVLAAHNTPRVGHMCAALLEFVRCARHHSEAGVRRAVIYAVCTSLASLPPGSIVNDPSTMADVGEWLRTVNANDADHECQRRAQQGLVLLDAVLHRELSDDK